MGGDGKGCDVRWYVLSLCGAIPQRLLLLFATERSTQKFKAAHTKGVGCVLIIGDVESPPTEVTCVQ